MSRDSRQYVAQEFNVAQALPVPMTRAEKEAAKRREMARGQKTHTMRDVEDARVSTAAYIIKDLKQVVKALNAKAVRNSDNEEAYEFAIELVKSVISSHE